MGDQNIEFNQNCQMQCVPRIEHEKINVSSDLPWISQVRLFFRRHLDLDTRRKIKKLLFLNYFWQAEQVRNRNKPIETQLQPAILNLKPGDLVKIRTRDEILSTLNSEGRLKGCSFLSVMGKYCGTTQKVLKPVNRFIDERNYKIKHAKGLVLLESVMCEGTDFYGTCDRSCLFFWREEWLDKL